MSEKIRFVGKFLGWAEIGTPHIERVAPLLKKLDALVRGVAVGEGTESLKEMIP